MKSLHERHGVLSMDNLQNNHIDVILAICLCGSGVGTFLMAPITEEILDRFPLIMDSKCSK